MRRPVVIDGYAQGIEGIAQGIELTGESRLMFCKTCWKNIGHRSSVCRFDHPHGEDAALDCSCSAGCFGLYGCSSTRPLVSCCARLAQYGTDFVEIRKAVVRAFHPNNVGSMVVSHNPGWAGKRPAGDLGEMIIAEAYSRKFSPWENCETTKGCAKGQLDCHTTGTVPRHAKGTRHKQLVFYMTVKPPSVPLEGDGGLQGTNPKEEWKK